MHHKFGRNRSRHVAEDWIKRSFDCERGGLLRVAVSSGSISVKAGATDKIAVTVLRRAAGHSPEDAQSRLDSIEIDFLSDGRDLTIHSRIDEGYGDVGLDFAISVPREFNLDLGTSGGDVIVDGLVGRTTCSSAGGSLHIRQAARKILASTSGGDITMEQTAAGKDEINADLERPPDGTDDGLQIQAATSGGTVRARLPIQLWGDCRLSTSGGDIIVHLDQSMSTNIEARTSGGSVSVLVPVKTIQRSSSTSIVAVMNAGGPTLSLSTSGGDIEISGL